MEKAKCFKQSEVFPAIAKAIRTVHETTREFVTHDRLVEALMDDPVIRITLDAAPKRGCLLSGRALVSNMVAWFSRRITAKTSKYQHDFERVKLAGKWAYKPSMDS